MRTAPVRTPQSAGSIVLFAATGIALLWASSAWHQSYEALWHTPIGPRGFARDLHFWIGDVLMTIFFLVVGLEIRRELADGELRTIRRAALPIIAAVGGMIAPALVYAAFNAGSSAARGWAIPMATDIAFAVGALALLGKRVPAPLRVLLLGLAVIDDIGAIIVIAIFYSGPISSDGLVVAAAGVVVLLGMRELGVRRLSAFVPPALVVWAGVFVAGIHPTIAGVVVGLLIPTAVAGAEHSPADRLREGLERWVVFGIMPIFAFANAGIAVRSVSLEGEALWVFVGVALGLAVGKPLGITAVSWLGTRFGAAELPTNARWRDVLVVGATGGIGFTMALFLAQLALPAGALLESAKLGILVGSGAAASVAFVLGRLLLRRA